MIKLEFLDYVEMFFLKYVFLQRGLSANTVASYSDSMLLFFRYCEESVNMKPDCVCFSKLSKQLVQDFCEWIETQGCSPSTRNQRLTAVHALFRYIQSETPEHASLCSSVLSIKMKKIKQEPPKYLSAEAVQQILSKPNAKTKEGIRDLAILSLLYDSAIRVQELVDLKVGDISIPDRPVIRVVGKGRKMHTIPISKQTANILKLYTSNLEEKESLLFQNRSANKLTRTGITYIINKYVKQVMKEFPDLINIKVTPHIMRHSKATHLLNAGVNLIYIRDLLGHSSITTTEIYASANPDFLRSAIEKASISVVTSSDVKTVQSEKTKTIHDFLKGYRVRC